MAGDVIAAIATGAGKAAVAVVRLSGPGSHAVVARLCPGPLPDERRLAVFTVIDPLTGRALDRAMVVLFREGSSYTGEEAAELHCHGGPRVVHSVLRACLDAGARPARAGEFTRRALAGGRLDLVQAEAVALLAEAATDAAVDVALRGLSGRPSGEVAASAERLADLLAEWEAGLDFAAEDGVEIDGAAVVDKLDAEAARMGEWLAAAEAARPALSGFRVALVGPPNAGKSSLFNALLGTSRAIVHEDPGTTRDVVSETIVIDGVPCVLLDTAGLRDAPGPVEAEGVARALGAAEGADCTVLVQDGGEDAVWPAGVRPDVVAWSKADLWDEPAGPEGGVEQVRTSAVDGRGIEALLRAIGRRAAEATSLGRVAGCVVAGERQIEALASARRNVVDAIAMAREGAPAEAVATALRAAVERLMELTGRRVTEDVLDRVFRRFCVGK